MPDRPRPATDASAPGALCATLVAEGRREAGLSRAALAARLRVAEHVVELWEDPTYEGHSLASLRRVARALGTRLELRFAPRARSHARALRRTA